MTNHCKTCGQATPTSVFMPGDLVEYHFFDHPGRYQGVIPSANVLTALEQMWPLAHWHHVAVIGLRDGMCYTLPAECVRVVHRHIYIAR